MRGIKEFGLVCLATFHTSLTRCVFHCSAVLKDLFEEFEWYFFCCVDVPVDRCKVCRLVSVVNRLDYNGIEVLCLVTDRYSLRLNPSEDYYFTSTLRVSVK